ncbi:hypothetical protein ACIBG0_26820 [Nocardia sp. NPDC050630]|uniref:hypothetical protein n=1 Tax=Nocardia sp. NPDC050630 TaxID=3364321 RepID=UPI00378CA8F7
MKRRIIEELAGGPAVGSASGRTRSQPRSERRTISWHAVLAQRPQALTAPPLDAQTDALGLPHLTPAHPFRVSLGMRELDWRE